jgi:iron complex transport system ATP-binding protein
MVLVAAGRIVHQGACADPATHGALAHVFDDRLRVRALDGQWLALPTQPGEKP